jgi:hypothetical protein
MSGTSGQWVLDDLLGPGDLGEHVVVVLSSALLRAARSALGEDGLAARAGVPAAVVAAAETGTCPVWALPYDEFTALADAAEAVRPSLVFETAAACDLLLSCVINGDQILVTDVLTEPGVRDLARLLLRQAIAGHAEGGPRAIEDARLPEDLRWLLEDRATALLVSESPDAWVGAEILAASAGRQS